MEARDLKPRLKDYLRLSGIEFDQNKSKPKISCFAHAEKTASMVVNDEYVKCFGCQFGGDIFKVAGQLHGLDTFPEQIKNVASVLGVELADKKAKSKKWITVSEDKSGEVYNRDAFQKSGDRRNYGKFIAGWKFKNEKGETEIVDVRFEDGDRKTVVSFWWDGEYLKHSRPPVRTYNRDKIAADKSKPILIVEGAKNAFIAEQIPGFITTTWNGGTGKVHLAHWGFLKGRDVYIYPDDDQQKHRTTKAILPPHEQPGIKAAFEILEKLPKAKVCKPLEEARKIKASGADIEEALQCKSPAELAKYIIKGDKIEPPKPKTHTEIAESSDTPFRILGTDDYGRAYFVGRNDRMWDFSVSALTKSQLLTCAELEFWVDEFGHKGKTDWEKCIDFIIDVATHQDFDPLCVRGRGAWSEPDGRLCYHDGQQTIGDIGASRMYVRKNRRDIGIRDAHVSRETLNEVEHFNSKLTYETKLDGMRLLAWSTIAPFGGALPWRPALLLTGPSGSGKSTIIDYIAKGISAAEVFSGGETTEPGVRQRIGNDSAAVIIEEAESDTKRKKINRDNLFSMMRQSTSNDAPIAAKGTKDGKGMYFAMRSTFLFVAIDPTIESIADDNRIFRINLKMPDAEQSMNFIREYKPQLKKILTYENCRGVRALVWKSLPKIIEDAHRYADVIQEVTTKDSRYSLAEALLLSTYQNIWKGEDLDVKGVADLIHELYNECPPEEKRDEAEEMLDKILDSKVLIEKPMREMVSLREIIYAIEEGYFEHSEPAEDEEGYAAQLGSETKSHLRGILNRSGLKMEGKGLLAIDTRSDAIIKSINTSIGYHRILLRHGALKRKSKVCYMAGKIRRCVVIRVDIDNRPEKDNKGY